MQTQATQNDAALGALARLLGLSPGHNAPPADGKAGKAFLDTVREQLREKLTASGLDTDALDGLDASTLLAQFLASQQAPLDAAHAPMSDVSILSAGDGLAAAPEMLADQLQAFIDSSLEQHGHLTESIASDRLATDGAAWLQQMLATLTGSPELRDAFEQHFGQADPQDISSEDLLAWLRSLRGADGFGRGSESGAESARVAADVRLVLAELLAGHSRSESTGQLPGGRDVAFRAVAEAVAQRLSSGPGLETQTPSDDLLPPQLETGASRMTGQIAFARTLEVAHADLMSGAQKNPLTLDLSRLLQPGGEERLAAQLRRMAGSGMNAAEIKLHPPSLGALEVRVLMQADRTHVQFISPHPIVREVLEAAMPRLRETLAQGGLGLGDVSVSDQPAEQGQGGSMQRQTQEGQNMGGWAWSEDPEPDIRSDPAEGAVAASPSANTLAALSRRLDYFI